MTGFVDYLNKKTSHTRWVNRIATAGFAGTCFALGQTVLLKIIFSYTSSQIPELIFHLVIYTSLAFTATVIALSFLMSWLDYTEEKQRGENL